MKEKINMHYIFIIIIIVFPHVILATSQKMCVLL